MSGEQQGFDRYQGSLFDPAMGFEEQFQDLADYDGNDVIPQSPAFEPHQQYPIGPMFQQPVSQGFSTSNRSRVPEPPYTTSVRRDRNAHLYQHRGYAQNPYTEMQRGGSYLPGFDQDEFNDSIRQRSRQVIGTPRPAGRRMQPQESGMRYAPSGNHHLRGSISMTNPQDRASRTTDLDLDQVIAQGSQQMAHSQARPFLRHMSNQGACDMGHSRTFAPMHNRRAQTGQMDDVNLPAPHPQPQLLRTPMQVQTRLRRHLPSTPNTVYATGGIQVDQQFHPQRVLQNDWDERAMSGFGFDPTHPSTLSSTHNNDEPMSDLLMQSPIRYRGQGRAALNVNSSQVLTPRIIRRQLPPASNQPWQQHSGSPALGTGPPNENYLATPRTYHNGAPSRFIESMSSNWGAHDSSSFVEQANNQSAAIDDFALSFGTRGQHGGNYKQSHRYPSISPNPRHGMQMAVQNPGVGIEMQHEYLPTPRSQMSTLQAGVITPRQAIARQLMNQMHPHTSREPHMHVQPQQDRIDALYRLRKSTLAPTATIVPNSSKKRKLDDTAAEDDRDATRSKRFDDLQLAHFEGKFFFPSEIEAYRLLQQPPRLARNVVPRSVAAISPRTIGHTPLNQNQPESRPQVGRSSKYGNVRQKKATKLRASAKHSKATTPVTPQAGLNSARQRSDQYDNAAANDVWADLLAFEPSISPVLVPGPAQVAEPVNVTSTPKQPLVVTPTIEPTEEPQLASTQEQPVILVNQTTDLLQHNEVQHLQDIDPAPTNYNRYIAPINERSSRADREASLHELLAGSFARNPTNRPSVGYRPSRLNELACAPRRGAHYNTVSAGVAGVLVIVNEPQSVQLTRDTTDTTNQLIPDEERIFEVTESSSNTEDASNPTVVQVSPEQDQNPEPQATEVTQAEVQPAQIDKEISLTSQVPELTSHLSPQHTPNDPPSGLDLDDLFDGFDFPGSDLMTNDDPAADTDTFSDTHILGQGSSILDGVDDLEAFFEHARMAQLSNSPREVE